MAFLLALEYIQGHLWELGNRKGWMGEDMQLRAAVLRAMGTGRSYQDSLEMA